MQHTDGWSRPVNLVDVPRLADRLTADERVAAAGALSVPGMALARGACSLGGVEGHRDDAGLLVVHGFLACETLIAGRRSIELLGPGDLLRPWDNPAREQSQLPIGVCWAVLEDAVVAKVDARCAQRMAPWPSLVAALGAAAIGRLRWTAALSAAATLPRVDARLLSALWLVRARFGVDEARTLPLRLTHDRLAALVGARRPSVSTALAALVRRGAVTPRAGRRLELHGDPVAWLTELDADAAVLHQRVLSAV